MSVDTLRVLAERLRPMFEEIKKEYEPRTPPGYPNLLLRPERGSIGLELDPNYSMYFVSDGENVFVEYYYRSPRNDVRSSASREKFSGLPVDFRRPVDPAMSDRELRNLVADLISRFNYQPMLIHITDT